jgi:hypothetical protein
MSKQKKLKEPSKSDLESEENTIPDVGEDDICIEYSIRVTAGSDVIMDVNNQKVMLPDIILDSMLSVTALKAQQMVEMTITGPMLHRIRKYAEGLLKELEALKTPRLPDSQSENLELPEPEEEIPGVSLNTDDV